MSSASDWLEQGSGFGFIYAPFLSRLLFRSDLALASRRAIDSRSRTARFAQHCNAVPPSPGMPPARFRKAARVNWRWGRWADRRASAEGRVRLGVGES